MTIGVCATDRPMPSAGWKIDPAWKPGPLPADTYGWGGVILKGEEGKEWFHLANFDGNNCALYDNPEYKVLPEQVAYYCNGVPYPYAEGA